MAIPAFGRIAHRYRFLTLLAVAAIMSPESALSAVSFDAVSTNSGDAGVFSHQHTVGGGGSRLLTVGISLDNGESVQNVTYGGTALIQQSAVTHAGGKPRVELWRLVDPPSGAADVVVTLSGGNSDRVTVGAMSFEGVDHVDPISDVDAESGLTTAISASVNSQSDDVVCDVVASLALGAPTHNASQTERWNIEMGGTGASGHFGSGSTQPGKNLVTMSWTAAEPTKEWAIIAYNVRAAECTDDVGDRFAAISYGGNDGTRNFSDDWIEEGEADGPEVGVVRVVNSAQCPSGNCLGIGAEGAGATDMSIVREANLAGATTANLSYRYRRDSDLGYSAGSGITVAVSSDGGTSWNTLQTLGTGSDASTHSTNYDISDYIGANTQIRFSTNDAAWIDGYAYFDDIVITHNCIDGGGSVYYVSPTGDDSQDGSSVDNAWESIDRGDQLGVLLPGDTVNVVPGTYPIASTIALTSPGTATDPIVYRKHGEGVVEIDMGGANDEILSVEGNHTHLSGLTLVNCGRHGIWLLGDSCIIREFDISEYGLQGIDVYGTGNLVLRNAIHHAGESGIVIRAGAGDNRVYGNTIYIAPLDGIWIDNTVTSTRVFNNYIVQANDGIEGPAGNICGFNGLWACTNPYTGGVTDSARGIIANPLFVDAAAGNFELQATSPAIDTGLNLGYDYIGAAPDMGAEEYGNPTPELDPIGPQMTVENVDLEIDISATDDASVPSLTTSALPIGASFVDNGDGSGNLDWIPTYLQSGTYQVIFYATDDQSAVDSEVVSITVTDAGNQHPVLDPIDSRTVLETDLLSFPISATDPEDTPSLTSSVLPIGAALTDNGDGSADFEWTPSFGQAGDYEITFYATDDSSAVDSEVVAIEVSSALNLIRIVDESGDEIGDLTLSADNDTTEFFCRAYKSGNGNLGYLVVEWSVIGEDSIGTVSPVEDSVTTLTLTTTGAGRVVASHSSGRADTTGVISCVGGSPVTIEISPQSTTLALDSTEQFSVTSFDADGNTSIPGVTPTWSTSGGVGTVNSSGLFTATAEGTGQVVATAGIMADTASVTITNTPADSIEITPNAATVSADSSIQFTATGYTEGGTEVDPGTITWSVVGGIGDISSDGLFEGSAVGPGRIVAVSSLGPVDTTGTIEVTPGDLATLTVAPDSVTTYVDSIVAFSVMGTDADGNDASTGTITWSVAGGIGAISNVGLFTATAEGTGQVVASSSIGGIVDTNGLVIVQSTEISSLTVTPDTATVVVGDALQFHASALTGGDTEVPDPDVVWEVLGPIGTIDSDGILHASAPGYGRVVARAGNTADTTNLISVKTLVTGIALGNSSVSALDSDVPLLAFRVDNFLTSDLKITEMTARSCALGTGSSDQICSAISNLGLYLDTDADSAISGADQLLDQSVVGTGSTDFSFSPVTISAYSGKNFIIAADISDNPTDSDSLDLWLRPASDIVTSEGVSLSGPDSLNSAGFAIIDGVVASQIEIAGEGTHTIDPAQSVHRLMTIDLPRNGYLIDTLQVFSVVNSGTGAASDVDSMWLYRDDGDGVWSGASSEIRVAGMGFTGRRWVASGLDEQLTETTNRYHVAIRLSGYPSNGATFSLGVPLNGIDMASGNDGPIDESIPAEDTVAVVTYDAVRVQAATVEAPTLIPGQLSNPIVGFSMTNTYGGAVAVEQIACRLVATAPDGSSQSELDSQVDSVILYANLDGDYSTVGAQDTLIASASLSGGELIFHTPGLSLPPNGGSRGFAIAAGINLLRARNGNTINFEITDSTGIMVADSIRVSGTFPLANYETAAIDAFPSAAVTMHSLPADNLFGGQTNQPVLDFELPRNGYADDVLGSLSIFNQGTLDQSLAIDKLVLWSDDNDNGYSSGDTRLGELVLVGGYWRLNSIDYALNDVSNRLIVTADFSDAQFQGGTIQYAIPADGIVYASGTEGPDDAAIGSDEAALVFPSDRITVISIPSESRTVAPGSDGMTILAFALYNGYVSQARTVNSIRLTNSSRTSANDADWALGQIALYVDTDGDRDPTGETVIGTGRFQDGSLNLTGLNISLPPDSLSYFFVQADIPLDQSDADSLTVSVGAASDFGFSEAANVNGDLPLTAGGYQIIDGSIAAQYAPQILPSQTISPGTDGKVLMGFRPAFNGNKTDILSSITISNAGDANGDDLDVLQLWRDQNGDLAVDAGDSDLGVLTHNGSHWTITGLNLTVDSPPPVLLVVGDISNSATPGRVFQGMIPVDGCQYASANDGPRDQAVTVVAEMLISNSALQISYRPPAGGVSLGDTIDIGVTVRNLSAADLDDVATELVSIDNPSIVSLASAEAGPTSILAGDSAVFTWRYRAVDVGSLSWYFRAVAPSVADTSATLRIGPTTIRQAPAAAVLSFYNSIPTAVARGQSNVFPLSLGLAHSDTVSSLGGLQLDSLTIAVEDESGNPLPADRLFSRVVLSSGYTTLAVIDSLESSAEIAIQFSSSLRISPGHQTLLSLLVDVADSAQVGRFRLVVAETEAVPVVDENSLQPVTIQNEMGFPLKTAACRIDIPSTEIAVSYDAVLPQFVNYGQRAVAGLRLRLYHPGETGCSPVQLTGLTLVLKDSLGEGISADQVCDEIYLEQGDMVVGYLGQSQLAGEDATVDLSAPITLHAGESGTVDIMASIGPDAAWPSFRMSISDSISLVARDLSSGSELAVVTDTLRLATGTAFPMLSGLARLRQPALPVQVCVESDSPPSIVAGSDSVALLSLRMAYDATDDYSSVRLPSLTIAISDSLGYPLTAASILDRVGWCINDGGVTFRPVDPFSIGAIWNLGDSGILIAPGDSIVLSLLADVDRDAVSDHFVMTLASEGIAVLDATDTTTSPSLQTSALCEEALPFNSSAIDLILPAGRPSLLHQAGQVRLAAPGQQGVTLLSAELHYSSSEAQGDVIIDSLQAGLLHRTQSGYVPADASVLFSSIQWLMDTDPVAIDSTPSGDTIIMEAEPGFTMARNETWTIILKADLRPDARAGNYVVSLADSTFLRARDYNLATAVWPRTSEGYPIRSAELSIGAGTLEESFRNYPNPFNPDVDGSTTLGFTIDADARVDIALYTITGERIAIVAEDSYRAAGTHSSDTWDGRNGAGLTVLPGTYFCRITARYTDGRTEELRRKVALVR